MQIPITNRPASINVPLQQWLGTEYDLYQWQINALYSLYRGRGLAFALSVNLSCARIATALNDNISPWISTISVPLVGMFLFECLFPNSFDNAGWVGFSIAFLSFLSGIALIYVDNSENRTIYGIVKDNFDKKLNFEKYKFDDQEAAHLLSNEASQADEDRNVAKLLLNKGNSFDEKEKKKRVRIISKPEYFNEDLENSQYCSDGPSSSVSEIVNEMVIYDYDEEDENVDPLHHSIPDIVSAVGSPICGFLVDKVGKRVSMLIISSILVLATHVWPCVPLLVSNHQVATAYGIVTVALNASLFGFPLIVVTVLILSMYLYYLNKMYNGTLEESISEDIVTSLEENSVNDDTTLSRRRSDDWLVTKVVAEGLLVFAPRTVVHHNHSSSELISSPTSPIRRGRSTCLCHSDHIMQENAECNNEISHVLRRNKSRSKTPVRNANLDNETE
ncbi:hypothetical protein HK099_003868 [Clydaea vesicula]|uniref:Uncharacterized protein n=1 Tax=Clydaea vesicula TaxID=447962 RepID=A0AAD5Y1E7_9FUNG|nr:hypothetical protein HK099_003868 [Clydaea vesicula]